MALSEVQAELLPTATHSAGRLWSLLAALSPVGLAAAAQLLLQPSARAILLRLPESSRVTLLTGCLPGSPRPSSALWP